ncbi:MAG: ABC transporter ATP-binding protein [Gammaproteobacteria bacterium]|nr:ABC transporter ATP-binding protein [Gammaproteobacteria bacterium]MDD9963351.1 ABC transporter ATP-binding protein [Gammaproteobacteria bacterium]MDE0272488.1 ABC transporter ATP-binding protein [Gammaproteobacteria bacterium]
MLNIRALDLGGPHAFSHHFAEGAITVVLGRNNAGKTRLARAVAGLDPSPPGTVFINGADVSTLSARRRRVGLVYQAFVNYPNWSVFDNIASPMKAAGMGRDRDDGIEMARTVEALAGRLQIGDLLDRLPEALSGGQQQRVAIARALAQQGDVLVMDEPLVNLDYKLREELSLQLREIVQSDGPTVLYLTSDPKDAFTLGDEVLLLQDRAKLQSGTPLEVYNAPVSAAAADLMSDPGVNRLGEQTLVRPEHLRLAPLADGDAVFEAKVNSVETSGAETFLHCRVGGVDWVARLPGMADVKAGARVRLYVAEDDLIQI